MRKFYFVSVLSVLAICASIRVEASEPRLSRDKKTCEEILNDSKISQPKAALANNTFVPLSVLISSTKCQMVAKNWREGPYHSKSMPTPGLLEMYRTADEAAADVIKTLGLKGIVAPFYDKRSPLEGAAATLEMMESASPPAYIRNGVLFREGVFTVVPLLALVQPASKKTGGKNIYAPLIAKGHQELTRDDIYTAAFTAWALEPWMGRTPDKAYIHLVPMAKQRKVRGVDVAEPTYSIDPKAYFPIIREVYEDFLSTVSSPSKLAEIQPRRCTECNRCPWASYCRSIMKDTKDLSMMPYPVSAAQVEVLKNHGLGDMQLLSRLDVNSPKFFEVALRTGITTARLKYAVSHAKAFVLDKPLKTRNYTDPFEGKRIALHIDFEDLMDSNIRSGVYLFGAETQDLSAEVSAATQKRFIFAKDLTQDAIDAAWAEFLNFVKKDLRLDRDDWSITMYSKHEIVKFEQQFNIVKGVPEDFSAAERRSPFYSEYGPPEKPRARMIRERGFFEKYPEISPADIFNIMDRCIDLLDYTRHYWAFPTYSNGIKHILKYVRTAREPISYPEGQNGLESMSWARDGYARKEYAFFAKAQAYNEIDIDVDRLISDFYREALDLPVPKNLIWTAKSESLRDLFDDAVSKKNTVVQLLQRKSLLEKAVGSSILSWDDATVEELLAILDRSDYVAARAEISDLPKIDPRLKNARLQKLRFEFSAGRQHKLYEFLRRLNPDLDNKDAVSAPNRAFVDLLQYPAHLLGPNHLRWIIVLAQLQKEYGKLKLQYPTDPTDRLHVSDEYVAKLKSFNKVLDLADELGVPMAELSVMWQGLYLVNAFGK